MVPRWICPRARSRVIDGESEASANREEERGEEKQGQLDAGAALTKFLRASTAGPR